MKIFKTTGLGEDCNICGIGDGLPFKIARTMTNQVLANERLHYHQKGYEAYLVVKGTLIIRVGDKTLEARAGHNDRVIVEPGEHHKIEQIIQTADYVVFNTNSDPKDKVYLE